jgi:signal transduction histidine kinase
LTSRTRRIRQIVSSLLSNAIKYTEHGGVTVRTMSRTDGPFGTADRWLLVAINDTGMGIPVNKQDFIFEEFCRIVGREQPGAGLGLAIIKLLAKALEGRITVDSEASAGSAFTLWLPAPTVDGPSMPAS